MPRLLLPIAIALAVSGAAASQTPAPAPAAISGIVVSAEAPGRPMRRAIVTLTGDPLVNNLSTVTDDRGTFAFTRLAPGSYGVSAAKPAYLSMAYGARRPGRPGTPLVVGPGQRVDDLRLTLQRGAVLGGVLRNPAGAPLPNTHVTVVPAARALGLIDYDSPPEGPIVSDERGVYRAYGLLPGEYLIAATPRSTRGPSIVELPASTIDALLRDLKARTTGVTAGAAAAAAPAPPPGALRSMAHAPIFYPGTPIVQEAARVRVSAGEVQDRLDFVVGFAPAATVSGRLVTTDGSALPGTQLSLMPIGPPLPVFTSLLYTSTQAADGAFSFGNVTPGRYVLSVRGAAGTPPTVTGPTGGSMFGAGPPGAALLWASAEIAVNGDDVTGVVLSLRPAMTFAGTILFEGTPPAAGEIAKMRVGLVRPEAPVATAVSGAFLAGPARPLSAAVAADRTFTIAGVTPGVYVPAASVPGAERWILRSAIVNGRDVLDLPLEVTGSSSDTAVLTFSDRRSSLSGSLQSASGQPASDYVIVVFPAERALWPAARRLKLTRPASTGRYAFADLPAGDYLIAALNDVDPDDWQRPDFLDQIAGASVKVTVTDGGTVAQDLRIR